MITTTHLTECEGCSDTRAAGPAEFIHGQVLCPACAEEYA